MQCQKALTAYSPIKQLQSFDFEYLIWETCEHLTPPPPPSTPLLIRTCIIIFIFQSFEISLRIQIQTSRNRIFNQLYILLRPPPASLLLFSQSQQTQNICITFVQRRSNVFDAGSTLYKMLYKCFMFAGTSFMVVVTLKGML